MRLIDGTVLDALFIMIALGVVIVSILVGYVIINSLSPTILASTAVGNYSIEQGKASMIIFGESMFFVAIAAGIAAIIFAFFLRSHPLFLVLSLIILAPTSIIAWILRGVYLEIIYNSYFIGISNLMPTMVATVTNLWMIFLFIAAAIIIALVAKNNSGSELDA